MPAGWSSLVCVLLERLPEAKVRSNDLTGKVPAVSSSASLRRVGGWSSTPGYYWLLLAESHLTRRLFGAMLQRIWALPVPMG